MKMKKAAVLLFAVFLSACSAHITDISVISNKNVSLNNVDIDKLPHVKNVIGKDSKFVFLFIPFGTPQIKTALNDALLKADGDLMVDASVYSKSWWFLFGVNTIEINGTVVKTRESY